MLQRLHQQRKRYIDSDCDKFDWYNEGRTAAERKQDHEKELDAVDKQIKNARASQQKYCKG